MANIKEFAPKLLVHEGGFVNHPKDPGGATMKGVTLKAYTDYRKRKGLLSTTVEDLKRISDDEWTDILKYGYWDKIKADDIKNQSIAEISVDWIYNSGPGMVRNIQRILGITADGIAGPKTVEAINNSPQKELFDKIWKARKDWYDGIVKRAPDKGVFYRGWINRLNSFKFEEVKITLPRFIELRDLKGDVYCINPAYEEDFKIVENKLQSFPLLYK